MFNSIFTTLNHLWTGISNSLRALFNFADHPFSPIEDLSTQTEVFSEQEKFNFVVYLLRQQKNTQGLGLRHVDSDDTKNHNLKNSFKGDAVSFSITRLTLSFALGTEVTEFSHIQKGPDKILLVINQQYKVLDINLAVKIFDSWYQKILPFMQNNFAGHPHYFMIIKDMAGAAAPYDIKDLYPSGKCGKQTISPNQIIRVFSKTEASSPENMLSSIINYLVLPSKPQHHYSEESTRAILSILREIQLTASDSALTEQETRRRLIEAELSSDWSDSKYESMYAHFQEFVGSIEEVNDDLGYFQNIMGLT
ncbi:hypothetical protein Lnau_1257 [Legionella nautarum]|uniref:Uncharacterized protein n=1 Tax=Legionella nautarum TaxID=45070 RepID=A0A0W0WVE8_9GAMM|nr:hypothetical protein [Legionella nautarum]KTD36273.1 hypothetical protein Lnau_1257 [Legionella nautarum]